MTVINILLQYREGLVSGLLVTLQLCLIVWSTGLILGALLGAIGSRWQPWLGQVSRIICFCLSGVPILVLLFWLHYPAQALMNVVINPFITAAIALSIVNIFAVSEIVRTALNDFPNEYLIAAKVSGLSPWNGLIHIQIPLLFRQILPTLLITQVNMLQATLFASLISVDEIFRVAQRINASIYKPVEIYTALGIFFLAVCLPLNGLAYWFRDKFTRKTSEI